MAGVQALCDLIMERRRASLDRKITAYPRNNPIASDIGPCTREMALAILHWQERPLFGPDLKARFERGNLIENTVLNELASLGVTVRVEREPFEIKDRKGRLVMRGKIDGFVSVERQDYPMEVKSLDPMLYRRIERVEDFDKYGFLAKYPKQIQAYLYAKNMEEGFFLLDDCLGHWKLIPVALDLEMVEQILRQCEAAVEAVALVREQGIGEMLALPPYHENPAVCRRCWAFGRVCTPPAEYHGLAIETDPEVEAQLDRRAALEPAHREYEGLDKEIKERVRGKDGLVVGNWLIQGKAITVNYKAKPASTAEQWRTTITPIAAPSDAA